MMELCRIAEAFLCSRTVFKEDLIDSEIRVIDPETVQRLLISGKDSILELSAKAKKNPS